MTSARNRQGEDARKVVLVEGVSDQLAVKAIARRLGRDLAAEGVSVVQMGGATNIARFLSIFSQFGSGNLVAGLYDQAEARFFQRGLQRAGIGSDLTRSDMEMLGFYMCVKDLEDELIRALGVATVEQVLDFEGDLKSFRTFQQQPAQQGKSDEARLRRFIGTRGGRKIHYAPLLVNALDLAHVPEPLGRLVAQL